MSKDLDKSFPKGAAKITDQKDKDKEKKDKEASEAIVAEKRTR